MKRNALLMFAAVFLGLTYIATLIGHTSTKQATPEEMEMLSEGEWRNVCGTVAEVQIHETVAYVSFQEGRMPVTLFKDVYEDVHVNDLREHDTLCIVGYRASHKGKKTFIGRRLGVMTE